MRTHGSQFSCCHSFHRVQLDTLIVLAAVNVVVDYRGYLYNVLLAVHLAPMRGKRLAVPHVFMYWFLVLAVLTLIVYCKLRYEFYICHEFVVLPETSICHPQFTTYIWSSG
jgi:hypothetical protein